MDNPYCLDYPNNMDLDPKNISTVLIQLDRELQILEATRSITICGGGALIVLDIIDRRTRDIDVISPKIDTVLQIAADKVAAQFGFSSDWLNNGPENLAKDLTQDWQKRTVEIFKGSHLEVRTLERTDLIATKVFAFCDREEDFPDLLMLRPTQKELEQIFDWVMARDASSYWPDRVTLCFARLKKALSHE